MKALWGGVTAEGAGGTGLVDGGGMGDFVVMQRTYDDERPCTDVLTRCITLRREAFMCTGYMARLGEMAF